MIVFSRPTGTVADDRARKSSTERTLRSCFTAFHRPSRRALVQHLCQSIGLAWVVAAIVIYPICQANREREARQAVLGWGGRYNVDRNALAEALPNCVAEWFGGENLHPVRSINLSHCDIDDDDLAVLQQFQSLEQINLCGCSRLTTDGVAQLRRLPRMKLVWVDGMSVDEAGRCLLGEPIAAAGY